MLQLRFFTLKICLIMLFTKIKFSRNFLNLLYSWGHSGLQAQFVVQINRGSYTHDHFILNVLNLPQARSINLI